MIAAASTRKLKVDPLMRTYVGCVSVTGTTRSVHPRGSQQGNTPAQPGLCLVPYYFLHADLVPLRSFAEPRATIFVWLRPRSATGQGLFAHAQRTLRHRRNSRR